MVKCSNDQMLKGSNVQMFKFSNFQLFKCSNVQESSNLKECSSTQLNSYNPIKGFDLPSKAPL